MGLMEGILQMRRSKRFLASILAATMLLLMIPAQVAFAADITLDVTYDSIVITSTGYSLSGNPEIGFIGSYAITGTSATNTIQVVSGTHNITLDNVDISNSSASAAMEDSCAFSIQGTSDVSLNLVGNNTLSSSRGYAGLHVSEGTKLTIDGSGSLTAQGGTGTSLSSTPYAAGAGIGGSGYVTESRFGTIEINGGTINATGGPTGTNYATSVFGAGAGIGGGGEYDEYLASAGTIVINGGTITATGGDGPNPLETSGGAGIGSGGRNQVVYHTNEIDITITDGTIVATGKADGAGIGGGNNKNGGPIYISGGNITAVGGHEITSKLWGGAGIGGGDNSFTDDITITGNAVVNATGGGAAAGIGGGQSGGVAKTSTANEGLDVIGSATITISGNAQVVARASTGYWMGGAGIGGGASYGNDAPGGNVRILGNASVTAYSGIDGQAIGVTRYYDFTITDPGYDNTLYIEDTITLRLFNHASTTAALSVAAYPATVTGSGLPYLVAYTMPTSGTFPAASIKTATTTSDNFEWSHSGSAGNYELIIYDEHGATLETITSNHVTFGNGAILRKPAATDYTITATKDGSGTISPSGSVTVAPGDNQTFTFTPDSGYRIKEILVDGTPVAISGTYTFSNVDADHTIHVVFELIPPSVGTGDPGGGGTNPPIIELPPKTGENSSLIIPLSLVLIASAMFVMLAKTRIRWDKR